MRTAASVAVGMGLMVAATATVSGFEAAATGPTSWVQSSYDDFHAGELLSVTLGADGQLTLAPELEIVGDTREAYVWDVEQAADGSIFVAAGADGRVYRFAPGAADAEPTVFFEAEGTVHALALSNDDELFVAASPGGSIWKLPLTGGGEAPEPLATLETRYVWALAVGGDGTLYAGTGDGGAIHRVGADGSADVLYDSAETHITALAIDDDVVLAGSADNGHLYRIDASGDVFVLFDAPMQQITAIAATAEGVFFSGIDEAPGSDDEDADVPGSDGESGEGAVYLAHPDGFVEQRWGSDATSPYALATRNGGVIIGTGGKGELFHVGATDEPAVLGDTEASQVTALRAVADGTLVGTSNLGRVYRFLDTYRSTGEYLSQVKDTATTSRWGRLRWRSVAPEGASIQMFSRSGNTEDPDETWSDWSAAYTDPSGTSITSPPARFVQWKAQLTRSTNGETPVLQWVELVYVQRNLRPEVDNFTVHPTGVIYRQSSSFEDGLPIGRIPSSVRQALDAQQGRNGGSSGGGSSFLGQAFYLPGAQTFTWEASDANGDTMTYSLEYRGENETTWKPVASELSDGHHLWDTTTVPDGLYRARLLASDAPSNPMGQELQGSATSQPLVVDNTAPRIDNLSANGDSTGVVRVTGEAVDATSLIRAMEFAVDGGAWHAVLPADGLPDAEREGIGFDTMRLEPGEHTIVVRVTDTALNSGTARLVVNIQ